MPDELTPTQLELLAWFRRNAPSLGELYEGALKMLYDGSLPGRTRFIAHAVREIRNRLPDVISGTQTNRLDYKTRMDNLLKSWQHADLPLGVEMLDTNTDKLLPDGPDVTLPRKIFAEIIALLTDHEEAREKPEDAARRLFINLAPENERFIDTLRPIVISWLEVTNWFMRKAHDSGQQDKDYNFDKLREKFKRFEDTIRVLIQGFFKTTEELDEILEEANS